MSPTTSPAALAAVRDYVRYLQRLGVTELPVMVPSMPPPHVSPASPVTVVAPPVTTSGESEAVTKLAQLEAEAHECRRCPLHTSRKHVVFGAGNPMADLVFVGEAPGREEDLQGQPFVGAAGQLLTRIIKAIGLSREQVYILNVIKCRPPQNRNPSPEEVAACRPIIQAQLACLRPRVICALGTFAAQALLQTEEKISRLRGRFHPLGEMQVMPTFHPAYLLRNPQHKRLVWEDMQRIQRLLGLRQEGPQDVGSKKR